MRFFLIDALPVWNHDLSDILIDYDSAHRLIALISSLTSQFRQKPPDRLLTRQGLGQVMDRISAFDLILDILDILFAFDLELHLPLDILPPSYYHIIN